MPQPSEKPPRKMIPYARQCIDESDIAAVARVLRSDWVAQGPEVETFEKALCQETGARYAVLVSSGTAALHVACRSLGIEKGDTGVVPAITFAATANCLRYCGADVVFCDVDRETGCAAEADFRVADTGAKIFLPVSYSGHVGELEKIYEYAQSVGAMVIEDAAHSLGSSYIASDGRRCRSGSCSHSDMAILSFHPVKHICAGEGGAVLTNDKALAEKARLLRSHGIEKTDAVADSEGPWAYEQKELGMHYRMTDFQAALGASQLMKLDRFIANRRRLVARYDAAFCEEPFARALELPKDDPGSAYHLYVVRFKDASTRRAAYAFLHAAGVLAQVHYRPVYRNPYYRQREFSLPGAEAFYAGCLSLPMYQDLSDEDQDYTIDCLKVFFLQRKPTRDEVV